MKQGKRIITKKEDKITRSLLFLLFVIFISILLRWVIFNSVTVTVPHLFFIIATPFCLFFFFGYSNFAHLRDLHMVWKCNTNLSEKWKIHPQPPKFHQNFFFSCGFKVVCYNRARWFTTTFFPHRLSFSVLHKTVWFDWNTHHSSPRYPSTFWILRLKL